MLSSKTFLGPKFHIPQTFRRKQYGRALKWRNGQNFVPPFVMSERIRPAPFVVKRARHKKRKIINKYVIFKGYVAKARHGNGNGFFETKAR